MSAELIVDEDNEATDVYASNHDTRIRRIVSVAALVDFRLRRRGSDAAFVYDPEIMEPKLAATVRGADLVMAGPPCQGHSNLNNQTRRDDVRNALYLTVPAFAVATRARVAIIENVPEVTSDRSCVVQTARQLFESAGYSVEEGILSADAMGWPQTRRRHFLIARIDAAPIPIREVSQALADAPPRSVWWAIGDLETRTGDDPMDRASVLSSENRQRIDWLFDNDEYDLPCKERVAVFLDGCFWHSCPVHGTTPHANRAWWLEKLAANVERDWRHDCELRTAGWLVLRFWEHEDPRFVADTIETRVCERQKSSATDA